MGKLKLFLLLKQERGCSGKRPETMLPLASVVLAPKRGSESASHSLALPRPNHGVLGSSRRDTVHPQARSLAHGGHRTCHLNLQIYMDVCHRGPQTAIIKFIHLECLKTQSGYS